MNRSRILRVVAFLCLSLTTLAFAYAQTGNLLTNPGFEAPFVEQGGEPMRMVAEGWIPWHLPAVAGGPEYQNQQPEYLPADPQTGRVLNGDSAQLISAFYSTHTGGLYQQVSGVASGVELTFGVNGYIWSSTDNDATVSISPGGVVLQVGIDPTGGTDPTSANIVWSTPSELYDAFNLYTVSAASAHNTVTVFIRSQVATPVQNTFVYLDEASLVAAGDVVDVGTQEVVATDVVIAVETAELTPETLGEVVTETPVEATEEATVQIVVVEPQVPTEVVAEATEVVEPTVAATTAPVEATEVVEPTAAPTTAPPATLVPPTEVPTVVPPTDVPTSAVGSTPVAVTELGAAANTVDLNEFPGTVVYTVQPGDTVQRLAIVYGSTIEAIIAANDLNDNALIYVGQGLVIPVRIPSPGEAAPTQTPIVIIVTATPGPTATEASAETEGGTVYIVQPGDTLFDIAYRFRTTVAAISQLNGIVNPNQILVGQRLVLPVPSTTPTPTPVVTATPVAPTATPVASLPETYVVQPGDSLYRIALRYGVPLSQLIRVNNLEDPNRIFIGQVLRLQ
jgi:LysM repeat protein